MDTEASYVLSNVVSATHDAERDSVRASDEKQIRDGLSNGTRGTDDSASTLEEAQIKSQEDAMPTGIRLGLMMGALCLSISLVALDSTIVSTAIPTLASRWGSIGDVGWYGSAYLLPLPTLQPSFGKAYPYGNTKYGFLAGLFIFEGGSLICALANSSLMFILGRATAGIGAALLAPGMLLILTETVPKHRRPLFTGIAASCAGVAACLGPVLGGIFTTRVSWRWCFYINLPLGVAASIIMAILYTPLIRERKETPWSEILLMMDLPGCALLTGSVVCLMLAFTFAGTGSWSAPRVIALLVLFAALLVFLVIEQAIVPPERALIPRSIIKQRAIILAALFGFLTEMASTTHVYYLPFYFQGSRSATALSSGVDILPYLVSQTIAGFVTGVTVNITRYFNPPMLVGSALFCIGSGLLYTITATTASAATIGYQIVAGAGVGAMQFMAMGIAQQVLERKDESIGLASVYMIKTLGSAVAVSLSSTIFNSHLRALLVEAHLSATEIVAVLSSVSSLGGNIPESVRPIAKVAVAKSIDVTFIIPLATGLAALVVACFTQWRKIERPGDIMKKEIEEEKDEDRKDVEEKVGDAKGEDGVAKVTGEHVS